MREGEGKWAKARVKAGAGARGRRGGERSPPVAPNVMDLHRHNPSPGADPHPGHRQRAAGRGLGWRQGRPSPAGAESTAASA